MASFGNRVYDKDSTGEAICFRDMGSRFGEIKAASASKTLDTGLPRLELDIQNAGSTCSPDSNVFELQHDTIVLTMKYELLQQETFESNKGCKKLDLE
jgi:hypothetical protein